ncbi:GNAT family N-acetyltransferase [Ornithinibacillus sp. L9]|uniref:GNAT family N-acetyltransferase n=1 Tax=Ornithinibacillus caprae TaxID=2678566 RepID=A0A6N8FDS4_9BACI|nr:GNAT family N-acetyltransferase [Ornithinibacillus caprae]MUK87812.1 GNAT family N-acetyltransferase [Ornithinibacillus caprae]
MDVSLSIAPYEDKSTLSHLIQLYRYDSSEFDGHVLNQHGLYNYKYLDHQWTEDYRRPFIVRVDGEIAGFALMIVDVPREFVTYSTAEKTHVISDFFIMRKFRHRGVGRKVAYSLFDQFQGTWEIKQTENNKPAYEFWKKIILDYSTSKSFNEKIVNNEKWNGPILVFES